MTGFRSMWRGSSLYTASQTARRTIGGSKRGRLVRDMLEQPSRLHEEMLHDGPEREGREKRECADDDDHTHQQGDEQRRAHGEGARGLRGGLLLREEAAEREHGDDH